MKAKVQLTDSYSGRSMNVVVNLENTEFDKYEFTWGCLSGGQRRKVEGFFGEQNAYHTTHEIIKTYE